MKTALLLIPHTKGINRTSYMDHCIRDIISSGYFPILYDIYAGHLPMTYGEFIKEALPKASEVFIFCDFSEGKGLRQMVEQAEPGREITTKTITGDKSSYLTDLSTILKDVAVRTNIPIELLKSRSRKREVCDARYVYFMRAKRITKTSLKRIGEEVGRDHSTVHTGIKTARNTREVIELYLNTYNNEEHVRKQHL